MLLHSDNGIAARHLLTSVHLVWNSCLIPVKCVILRMEQREWNKTGTKEPESGTYRVSFSPPFLILPFLPYPQSAVYLLVQWFLGDDTISSSQSSNPQPIIQHEAWNIRHVILQAWNNAAWITYLIANGGSAVAQAIPDAHSFCGSARGSSEWGRQALSSSSMTICCLWDISVYILKGCRAQLFQYMGDWSF